MSPYKSDKTVISMKSAILLLVILISVFNSYSQDFSAKLSALEKITEDINASLPSCKQIKLENNEVFKQITDGGAELIGYFRNHQIQKIELSIGLSHGIREFQFFYENSELIYVKEVLRQYIWDDSKGVFDYSKTERTFRGDYIFKEGFDLITLGHNRFEDDELDPELTLKEESQRYRKKLESKL